MPLRKNCKLILTISNAEFPHRTQDWTVRRFDRQNLGNCGCKWTGSGQLKGSWKTAGIKKLPNLTALQAEYEQLQAQKETLYVGYGKLKKQVKEYDVIKRNIDSILRQDKEPEYNKEATRE